MNREQYLAQRKAMLDEAQKLVDSGKLEEAAAKAKDIEELDAQFENVAKAQANLNALSGRAVGGLQNAAIAAPVGAPVAGVDMTGAAVEIDRYDTAEYKNAFMAYVMRGTAIPAKLTNEAGPTKTTDVGTVIPTTTLQKITLRIRAVLRFLLPASSLLPAGLLRALAPKSRRPAPVLLFSAITSCVAPSP